MLAEIRELDIDQGRGGRRDKHLAAMSYRRDPGGAMDIVADITFPGEERRARVEAGTYSDRALEPSRS